MKRARRKRVEKVENFFGDRYRNERIGEVKIADDHAFPFYSWPQLYYLMISMEGRIYESGTTYHILENYRDRKICFVDIGAFYGYFSSLIGSINPANEVHAFEPSPVHFEALEKNITLNCPNGHAHRLALSDSNGEIAFEGVRMLEDKEKDAMEVMVPTERFDDWRARTGVTPDIVKLDVHGGEGKVLFGMQETLRDCEFKIYFEIHPEDILVGYTLKEVVEVVMDNGFDLFEIKEFRGQSRQTSLARVEGEALRRLKDQSLWTEVEYDDRRMFYCEKR